MIRIAEIKDLSQISRVHFICFPKSFSTAMGKGFKGKLMENFYLEYLKKVPELFLVVEDDKHQIVGFCMGYYCDDYHYDKSFIRNNFLKLSLRSLSLIICGNKMVWKKIMSFIKPKKTKTQQNNEKKQLQADVITKNRYSAAEKVELLSICVLPEYRGTNIARDLVNAFISKAKIHDRKLCCLTVLNDNGRGIAFYEKLGFEKNKVDGESIHMSKGI